MVGGFAGAASTGAGRRFMSPRTAAQETIAILASGSFMAPPSAWPEWPCPRPCRKWRPIHSGLVFDRPRFVASELAVGGWRALVGSDFAVRTAPPGAAAIGPCARSQP